MHHVIQDLRYAWRGLVRSPAFASIVVLTMAIGVGANSTVLGFIDTLFFRKLPVPQPERIVRVQCGDSTTNRRLFSQCSFPEWQDLSTAVRGLDGLAAFAADRVKLGGELSGLTPDVTFVSGNYFAVLALTPQRGRFISPDEVTDAVTAPVVVVSDWMWRHTFRTDPQITGRRITIGHAVVTIIGVAPAWFSGTTTQQRTDLWIPYTLQAALTGEDVFGHRDATVIMSPLIGRLRKGATLAEVQASLSDAALVATAPFPGTKGRPFYKAAQYAELIPLNVESSYAFATALAVWMVVALVHLIACSNIASLMLARLATRQREIGIRLSLGASRSRVVTQYLAEPVLLAMLGAAGGLLVTYWLTGLATQMWFISGLGRGVDLRTVVICAGLAAGTALSVGLTPALTYARRSPLEAIRGTSATGKRQAGSMGSIIVSQVSLSLVLVAQALLLVGKYRNERAVELGYEGKNLIAATVHLNTNRQVTSLKALWATTLAQSLERATAVPGTRAVSWTASPPLAIGTTSGDLEVAGYEYGLNEPRQTPWLAVGPGYFSTIGTEFVAGREFTAADAGGFTLAIVNESFARRYWKGADALGRSIRYRRQSATVIGVVRDTRDVMLSTTVPRVYFPAFWASAVSFTVVARLSGDPDVAAATLRTALASLPETDPPVVRTIESLRADQLQVPLTLGYLLSACAGVALLLTGIGLYGTISMWATARRSEMGMRLALGATARHIYSAFARGAGRYVGFGAALGVAASVALVQVERAQWGRSLQFDIMSVSLAVAAFGLMTMISAGIPARRASRMSPSEILRE